MADIHITSISELIAFGNGEYGYGTDSEYLSVYLDGDLDFAVDDNEQWKYSNWNGCTGAFYVNFDGQNHFVKNISYNGTSTWGFFRNSVTGNISNLKILDLQVFTTGVAGGIIGEKTSGGRLSIRNCHVSGNIVSTGQRAAGIIGNRNGTGASGFSVDFCTFSGIIRGNVVSGIANFADVYMEEITVTCCGVRADLVANAQCSTLLFGTGYYVSAYPGEIRRCYFIGTMSGGELIAGYNIAGRCTEDYAVIKSANRAVTFRSVLYDSTVAEAAGITINGGTGITTEDLKSKAYLRDILHWAV